MDWRLVAHKNVTFQNPAQTHVVGPAYQYPPTHMQRGKHPRPTVGYRNGPFRSVAQKLSRCGSLTVDNETAVSKWPAAITTAMLTYLLGGFSLWNICSTHRTYGMDISFRIRNNPQIVMRQYSLIYQAHISPKRKPGQAGPFSLPHAFKRGSKLSCVPFEVYSSPRHFAR
jgi:hypothetical protein